MMKDGFKLNKSQEALHSAPELGRKTSFLIGHDYKNSDILLNISYNKFFCCSRTFQISEYRDNDCLDTKTCYEQPGFYRFKGGY